MTARNGRAGKANPAIATRRLPDPWRSGGERLAAWKKSPQPGTGEPSGRLGLRVYRRGAAVGLRAMQRECTAEASLNAPDRALGISLLGTTHRNPMLLFQFEGALFRFREKTPSSAPLFQLPPRSAAASLFSHAGPPFGGLMDDTGLAWRIKSNIKFSAAKAPTRPNPSIAPDRWPGRSRRAPPAIEPGRDIAPCRLRRACERAGAHAGAGAIGAWSLRGAESWSA